jgi:16S rRNA C1402 (ribose-2'-O) methylase RsmI
MEMVNDTIVKDFDTIVNEVSSQLIASPELHLKEVIREYAKNNGINQKELYNAILARRKL